MTNPRVMFQSLLQVFLVVGILLGSETPIMFKPTSLMRLYVVLFKWP
jgi:hypothetical protein